jgi:hypothetical protein
VHFRPLPWAARWHFATEARLRGFWRATVSRLRQYEDSQHFYDEYSGKKAYAEAVS